MKEETEKTKEDRKKSIDLVEVKELTKVAHNLTIESDEDKLGADNLYASLHKAIKSAEGQVEEILSPYKQQKKDIETRMGQIKAAAEKALDPYRSSRDSLKGRIIAYIKKREKELIESSIEKISNGEEPEEMPAKTSKTASGHSVSQRNIIKFKVVDISKVNPKYLVFDETQFRKDYKNGEADMSGVEIEEDIQLAVK